MAGQTSVLRAMNRGLGRSKRGGRIEAREPSTPESSLAIASSDISAVEYSLAVNGHQTGTATMRIGIAMARRNLKCWGRHIRGWI